MGLRPAEGPGLGFVFISSVGVPASFSVWLHPTAWACDGLGELDTLPICQCVQTVQVHRALDCGVLPKSTQQAGAGSAIWAHQAR
jgi:hypothetical protein